MSFKIWKITDKSKSKGVFLFDVEIKNSQIIGNRYDLDDSFESEEALEYVRIGFERKLKQINCDFKGKIRFDPEDFIPETTFYPYRNPKKLRAISTHRIQVVVRPSREDSIWSEGERKLRSAIEGKGMEIIRCQFRGLVLVSHAFSPYPEYDFEDTLRED